MPTELRDTLVHITSKYIHLLPRNGLTLQGAVLICACKWKVFCKNKESGFLSLFVLRQVAVHTPPCIMKSTQQKHSGATNVNLEGKGKLLTVNFGLTL